MSKELLPSLKGVQIPEDLIESTESRTDSTMSRMIINFKNGYCLSIIRGAFSYGGDQGLFEIALYNKEGKMDGKVLGIEYDDVIGYLTIEDVQNYALKIGNIK